MVKTEALLDLQAKFGEACKGNPEGLNRSELSAFCKAQDIDHLITKMDINIILVDGAANWKELETLLARSKDVRPNLLIFHRLIFTTLFSYFFVAEKEVLLVSA